MNEIFPINGYDHKKYEQTQAAFSRLLVKCSAQLGSVTLVEEAFAGMGGQTKMLRESYPNARHNAWEKDEVCFLAARATNENDKGLFLQHGECDAEQMRTRLQSLSQPRTGLLVVDGAFTLAQLPDYQKYLPATGGHLILCEQARRRLHLHKKTYGLEGLSGETLYETYLGKVAAALGRPLVAYETTNASPSYVMFGPSI